MPTASSPSKNSRAVAYPNANPAQMRVTGSSRVRRALHALRDTMIVTAVLAIAAAIIVAVGLLAGSLPATVVAVAGFLGFVLVVLLVTFRETP